MCPSGANAGAIGRRLGLPEAASAVPADAGLIAQIGIELRASHAKLRCHHRRSTEGENRRKAREIGASSPAFRWNPQQSATRQNAGAAYFQRGLTTVTIPPPFNLCKETLFANDQPCRATSQAGFSLPPMLGADKKKPFHRWKGLWWCPGPESNRHALRRGIFLPLRLSPPLP